MELWLPVRRYEGLYEVSDEGRVRRVGGHVVKAHPRNKYGHLKVRLFKNGKRASKYVHILVITAFVGPKPRRAHLVRHLDGCSSNNRRENLKWGTRRQNIADSRAHGTLRLPPRAPCKLTHEQIVQVRARAQTSTMRALAAEFGVSPTTIRDYISQRRGAA